jgi:hypothetical protein
MVYKDGTKDVVKSFSERVKIGGVQGEENFCPRAVSKIAKKFCVNQSAPGFCLKEVLTSFNMVDRGRFELPTSALQMRRSSQLN